jgi:hypothetical protein
MSCLGGIKALALQASMHADRARLGVVRPAIIVPPLRETKPQASYPAPFMMKLLLHTSAPHVTSCMTGPWRSQFQILAGFHALPCLERLLRRARMQVSVLD